MKMLKSLRIIFLLLFLLICCFELMAQSLQVSGKVIDSEKLPLEGVSIAVKKTNRVIVSVISNKEGEFIIPDLKSGNAYSISFTHVGYEPYTKSVDSLQLLGSPLLIELKSISKGMDQVVVVGYGTQKRRNVTTAISRYDGKKMEGAAVNSVADNLKGKMGGVRVTSTNMQPGANPSFLIRGGSSINQSNDPIILVDGVQRDITGLNPNDIESVEVLKDAASAGIYGARASNGVIMITTKKGGTLGAQITFQVQTGLQQPETKFDLMSAGDYIKTVRPALAESLYPSVLYGAESAGVGNDENSIWTTRYLEDGEAVPAGWQSIIDPVNTSKTIIFQNTDQQKKWFDNASWSSAYVGVNGGSDKIQYAASSGYTDDGGIGIATGFKAFTFHGNTTFEIRKGLKASTAFDYGQTTTQDYPDNTRNTVIRGLSIPFTHRDYLPDGTPALGTNTTTLPAVFYETYYDRNNIQKRSSASLKLDWKVIENLNAVAQITSHNRHTRSNYFIKGNAISSLRETGEGYSETNRLNFQTYLNYKKKIKDVHEIDVLGGYDYTYDKVNSLDARVTGAISDNVPTLNAGTLSVTGYPKSTRTNEALISYFGRANYSYLSRYLLSFVLRADGSSKFSQENRWGYFPAASLGWIVSDERFWKNNDWVNQLKLRASYGATGNNGIGLYDTYGSYTIGNTYNGNSAVTLGTMPNYNLRWETTNQLDIGADLSFFQNKIRISADYYNKQTNDLLFSITLPDITGYSTSIANVGKVKFYGFDFELSSTNIRKGNFEWTTDFTYSYNMNKVLKLADNGNAQNRINGTIMGNGDQFGGIAEGERLGGLYGYRTAYIIETMAEADAAMYDALSRGYRTSDRQNSSTNAALAGRKDIGDYEWLNRPGTTTDANGNDIINAEDQFLLGYVTPHSTGGVSNNFRYKNFALGINLDYAVGHTIFNNLQMRYFMATMGNANYNLVYDVLDAWKQPGDNTKYAKFNANDPDWGNRNYSRTSNVFAQKGDYLCIRDVVLSYSLSDKLCSRIGMKNLTLSVSGNTLYYFTEVKGVSPEAVTTGSLYSVTDTYDTNYNPYPPARKILFGIKANF
ncbi:MAG: SusC/RagA family TonB-linked outer membrane protein [Niabella sp.]